MKALMTSALKFLLWMTILTGIFYPLFITGLAQVCYPVNSNGSLIHKNGKTIGSELIGQSFDSTLYFWSRPSATNYNPIPSGSSNLGPVSNKLKEQALLHREVFARMNLVADPNLIPNEMIFSSASGLDPHISPEGALLQVDRVSNSRKFDNTQKERLIKMIGDLTEKPQLVILGQERINVLKLNIELDKLESNK
jgi:potassium-transporting ATPase KdpC subunit